MPLRLSSAPQDTFDALTKEIDSLERQLRKLKQPGRISAQVLDYEKQIDPVEGEVAIHHPGQHSEASPDSPLVYWHDDQWNEIAAGSITLWPYASASVTGATVASYPAFGGHTDIFLDDGQQGSGNGTVTTDISNGQGIFTVTGSPGNDGILRSSITGLYFVQGSVQWRSSGGLTGRFLASLGYGLGFGSAGFWSGEGAAWRTRDTGDALVQSWNQIFQIYTGSPGSSFIANYSILVSQNSGATQTVDGDIRVWRINAP
jgi:hypothetical protein